MEIYILVEVCYDYYRFQDNVGADTDKARLISNYNNLNNFEIVEYEADSKEQKGFDDAEKRHLWIEKFSV